MRRKVEPDTWRLFVNGVESVVHRTSEIRQRIAAARKEQFAQVQLVRGERPEHNLFALFNGSRAVMSYTRNIDESSYSARSKDAERDGEPVAFYLSNGQCDEYPLAHTIPASDAARAFEWFFRTEEMPEWIGWHRDF